MEDVNLPPPKKKKGLRGGVSPVDSLQENWRPSPRDRERNYGERGKVELRGKKRRRREVSMGLENEVAPSVPHGRIGNPTLEAEDGMKGGAGGVS